MRRYAASASLPGPNFRNELSRTTSEFHPTCGDFTDDGNGRHLPRKNSCSRKFGRLIAALEQPLHSQAYPKEGLAGARALQHGISQTRVVEAAQRGEVPDAGQNDLVRGCDGFRLRGYDDFSAEIVKRLLHRIQVAGAVIHDGDRRSVRIIEAPWCSAACVPAAGRGSRLHEARAQKL